MSTPAFYLLLVEVSVLVSSSEVLMGPLQQPNSPQQELPMSNTALTIYTFPETQTKIRTVTVDGALWFVAADVCRALGTSAYNVSAHLGKLDAPEKQVITNPELSLKRTKGQIAAKLSVISESGLYKLIMRSDKPIAKTFQNWVTQVVLPAIRKDGMYVMGEEKVATGEMNEEELILKAYGLLQAKVERLKAEKEAAEAKALVLEAKTEELVEESQTISNVLGIHNHKLTPCHPRGTL
jgi:prophage antirepressor-like protein